MKKLFILLVSILLLSLSSQHNAFADDEDSSDDAREYSSYSDDDDDDMEENESDDDSEIRDTKKIAPRPTLYNEKTPLKDMRNASKEEMKKIRDDARAEIEANRDMVKENLKSFKTNNSNELKNIKADLTDEQKATLKELSKMFQEDMDTLKEEFKAAITPEEKDKLHAQMQELVDTHYIAIKDVLGDNADAVAILEERQSVYEENEDLREENRTTREEYRSERQATVEKYRTSFIARLGNALDKISDEKLEKLVTRIDTMLASYEANTTLTEERKDKILGQLIALKEIIEEHLETQDVEDDVLDIIDELTAQ